MGQMGKVRARGGGKYMGEAPRQFCQLLNPSCLDEK